MLELTFKVSVDIKYRFSQSWLGPKMNTERQRRVVVASWSRINVNVNLGPNLPEYILTGSERWTAGFVDWSDRFCGKLDFAHDVGVHAMIRKQGTDSTSATLTFSYAAKLLIRDNLSK